MSETTILHNPRCSTSRAALEEAAQADACYEVRNYLKEPLTETELRELIAILEDPVGDLVRRDPTFIALGLDSDDIADEEAVVATLLREPPLLQRPILIRAGRAIIGRPKHRVRDFLR